MSIFKNLYFIPTRVALTFFLCVVFAACIWGDDEEDIPLFIVQKSSEKSINVKANPNPSGEWPSRSNPSDPKDTSFKPEWIVIDEELCIDITDGVTTSTVI